MKQKSISFCESLERRLCLSGNGLRGEYFDNIDFTNLKFTRTDAQVNFDFDRSSPLPRFVSNESFSVRWLGQIQAATTGLHTFHLTADDGVRLWVRGQLIIDQWQDRPRYAGDATRDHRVDISDFGILAANFNQSPRTFDQGDFDGNGAVTISDFAVMAANFNTAQPTPEYTGQISLNANQSVDFKLEFYESSFDAEVRLDWTPPGAQREIVPQSRFIDSFTSGPTMISNPIIPDGADPWVVQHEGEYLYCRSDGGRLFIHRSPTLQGIGSAPGVMIFDPPSGTMYSENLWAPELHLLDGKWYVYFAADNGPNENHRMYVLESNSTNPQGSYTFKGKIAATTDRWAIDGTVATINDERFFIWSGWQGATDGRQDLYIARMSNPWTIIGERSVIALPILPWEQHGLPINEGPTALYRNGKVHIIYSASGFWTNEYALGQLTLVGANPMFQSSWQKKATPVFSKTSAVVGVGHASFVKSQDGLEDWIVYHAHNTPGTFTGIRDIRIQRFGWFADDSPDFGAPINSGALFAEPSGTPHIV